MRKIDSGAIIMIKNYLKIAFRNLWKYKAFSFINLTGLAIGMAVCILILLWVQDELNFDNFHENGPRLYRVIQDADYAGHDISIARTPFPLAPALKNDFPEITDATRVFVNGLGVKVGDKSFEDDDMIFADPSFLKMFSFPMIEGDPTTALDNPLSIILTEKTALRYFGTRRALGKTLIVRNKFQVQVTGILKDIPHNSHLQFDFVVPMNIVKEFGFDIDKMPWTNSNNSLFTYVELKNNTPASEINSKIAGIMAKHVSTSANRMFLQPFSQIHLHSNFVGDVEGQGDIKYVYIFSIMAIFVLLIACINFMNLTTARSGNRAKEVGMRKVIGASRKDIIRQFFGESTFLSVLALGLALVLVELLLPLFNHLSHKNLAVAYLGNTGALLGFLGIAILTGLIAGSYPALFLSSFQPVKVLKGNIKAGAKSSLFRRILVVIQFTLSIILIIATTVVYSQISFMNKKNLGFDKQQLVYIHLNPTARQQYESLKNELLKNPNVENITVASHLLTDVTHAFDHVSWEGKSPDESITMNGISVDYDFIKTFGMQLTAGRDFSRVHGTDATQAYIVNEAAARKMGVDSPVGKQFSLSEEMDRPGKIIGVVKDFHFKPLSKEIEPMVIFIGERERYYLYARIQAGDMSKTITQMEQTWKAIIPGTEFHYGFFDDALAGMYGDEKRVGTLFNYFTILAIFISCLGLFGLSSFMAEQRTKEIGIRKVLGASVSSVVGLLSREFSLWVFLANILAWPIAWYFMNQWLLSFAYRTQVNVWIFFFAGILAMIIAMFTISFQAIKAATVNPVKALRYE